MDNGWNDIVEKSNRLQITNARSRNGYPLGRLVSIDKRDYDYPAHMALSLMSPRVDGAVDVRVWDTGPVLNQGNTNHCVGYDARSFIDAAPMKTRGGWTGDQIYYRATEIDEWPQTHNEDGTSLRAGAKVLVELGHAAQFVHAFDVNTIAQWITTQGTVQFGSNWYAGMNNPTASDGWLLRATGGIVGGHAYHLIGVHHLERKFRMKQSWGAGWGQAGYAFITFDTVAKLLAERGDAIMMLETPVIQGAMR